MSQTFSTILSGSKVVAATIFLIVGCATMTCVDDALGEDGAELGHDVLVLVHDDLGVQRPELLDLKKKCFRFFQKKKKIGVTLGEVTSVCWTRIMAEAMRAPCRTKLTGSLVMGSRRAIASLRPVPAHAIPSAIAAP